MSRHESFINRILPKIVGAPVAAGVKLFYEQFYGILDFTSDDMIPNLRAVKALLAGGGVAAVNITAGTTGTPKTVPYAVTANPSYTLQRASDNSFDWNTGVTYDGTNFVINGADDGTGKFADSFVFTIKP